MDEPQTQVQEEQDTDDEELVTVNFKMPRTMRDDFKRSCKKNGGMQSVLYCFAQDYIENAPHLRMRIVDTRGGDNGGT